MWRWYFMVLEDITQIRGGWVKFAGGYNGHIWTPGKQCANFLVAILDCKDSSSYNRSCNYLEDFVFLKIYLVFLNKGFVCGEPPWQTARLGTKDRLLNNVASVSWRRSHKQGNGILGWNRGEDSLVCINCNHPMVLWTDKLCLTPEKFSWARDGCGHGRGRHDCGRRARHSTKCCPRIWWASRWWFLKFKQFCADANTDTITTWWIDWYC